MHFFFFWYSWLHVFISLWRMGTPWIKQQKLPDNLLSVYSSSDKELSQSIGWPLRLWNPQWLLLKFPEEVLVPEVIKNKQNCMFLLVNVVQSFTEFKYPIRISNFASLVKNLLLKSEPISPAQSGIKRNNTKHLASGPWLPYLPSQCSL